MGPGRRGRGAGRQLARPAAARFAARHGRARRRRRRPRSRGRRGQGADAAAVALSSKLLAEERRLFYVAVTRAAARWWSPPSAARTPRTGRPGSWPSWPATTSRSSTVTSSGQRWLSLPALTADLRRAVADGQLPAHVRRAAAAQLARLAAAGVRGASPRQWYALTELIRRAGRSATGDVRVSPSQVETFTKCGLRWLLEAAVGAGSPARAQHLGTVIHAAAALAAEGADDGDIAKRIDEIWQHLDFGSAWYSAQAARRRPRAMVAQVPRLAPQQPARAGRGRAGAAGRVGRDHHHRPGRPAGARRRTAPPSWST